MGRGAPRQSGLDYFPKMVNFYEDDKIFDLLDRYGPLGVTIYDCILTIVYSNGYYANISEDKLSRMVIKKIGNKWIRNKQAVVQVIDYCADLGLLSKDLMLRDIITSVGIQKRYYKIAVKLMKRRLYSDEYWLLDEEGESLLNAPIFPIVSEENQINSETNPFYSENSAIKKNKEKENKLYTYVPDERLNQAILDFISYQKSREKPMSDKAVEIMLRELREMSPDVDKQIKILEQTISRRWAWIHPIDNSTSDKKCAKPVERSKNRFRNFEEREHPDYDSMVWNDMKKRKESGGEKIHGGNEIGVNGK